jgi:hypothetical protein
VQVGKEWEKEAAKESEVPPGVCVSCRMYSGDGDNELKTEPVGLIIKYEREGEINVLV